MRTDPEGPNTASHEGFADLNCFRYFPADYTLRCAAVRAYLLPGPELKITINRSLAVLCHRDYRGQSREKVYAVSLVNTLPTPGCRLGRAISSK